MSENFSQTIGQSSYLRQDHSMDQPNLAILTFLAIPTTNDINEVIKVMEAMDKLWEFSDRVTPSILTLF